MNHEVLKRIAAEVSRGRGVSRTPRTGLAVKPFSDGSERLTAIQQNPRTGSEWAKLAREGHKVVQFKRGGCYVAVSVDGKIKEY